MTTLECATAGCSECRETVKEAHRFRSYDSPPIRLHEPPVHKSFEAQRKEVEADPEYLRWVDEHTAAIAVQEVEEDPSEPSGDLR